MQPDPDQSAEYHRGWDACLEAWSEETRYYDAKPEAHTVVVPDKPLELVGCDNCGFLYAAEHVTDTGYTCPLCAETRLTFQNQRLRVLLQGLVEAVSQYNEDEYASEACVLCESSTPDAPADDHAVDCKLLVARTMLAEMEMKP